MSVVRLSRGSFDPQRFEAIRAALDESQQSLVPAIKTLAGNQYYYAGIDQVSSTMINVSVWESAEAAHQMDSLKAMQEAAAMFIELGVRFERPIVNYEVLWEF
jgi:quinol monooxygenase YgiN